MTQAGTGMIKTIATSLSISFPRMFCYKWCYHKAKQQRHEMADVIIVCQNICLTKYLICGFHKKKRHLSSVSRLNNTKDRSTCDDYLHFLALLFPTFFMTTHSTCTLGYARISTVFALHLHAWFLLLSFDQCYTIILKSVLTKRQ